VRLALIGAGRMGRMHLRALADSPSVTITDVVEPASTIRDALDGNGLRVHARFDDLLAGPRPDGVLIAVPTDRHAEVVAQALTAGLAVLCEKPAGTTAAQVAATGESARQAGVAYQVAYWRRFVPQLVELRRRLAAGELGELLHLLCAQWDGEPPPAAFRRSSGGIFADMGVHEFDVIRWLTGRGATVVAARGTPALNPEARPDVDGAQVLLALDTGATATVSLGRHHPGGDLVTLEVYATRGHELITVLDPADGDRAMLEALALQAESFARLLRGGTRSGAGTPEAVATLEDAEAAAALLRRP
jgi:myo-inositol 2-dehydrogenase / D-chiro-inositol 1-dehydrogenase